jgi:hypothetical protein
MIRFHTQFQFYNKMVSMFDELSVAISYAALIDDVEDVGNVEETKSHSDLIVPPTHESHSSQASRSISPPLADEETKYSQNDLPFSPTAFGPNPDSFLNLLYQATYRSADTLIQIDDDDPGRMDLLKQVFRSDRHCTIAMMLFPLSDEGMLAAKRCAEKCCDAVFGGSPPAKIPVSLQPSNNFSTIINHCWIRHSSSMGTNPIFRRKSPNMKQLMEVLGDSPGHIKQSPLPGGGLELCARRSISEGEVIAFYSGDYIAIQVPGKDTGSPGLYSTCVLPLDKDAVRAKDSDYYQEVLRSREFGKTTLDVQMMLSISPEAAESSREMNDHHLENWWAAEFSNDAAFDAKTEAAYNEKSEAENNSAMCILGTTFGSIVDHAPIITVLVATRDIQSGEFIRNRYGFRYGKALDNFSSDVSAEQIIDTARLGAERVTWEQSAINFLYSKGDIWRRFIPPQVVEAIGYEYEYCMSIVSSTDGEDSSSSRKGSKKKKKKKKKRNGKKN